MDLLSNPFHLIGASVRDDRKKLHELSDEQSLFLDPGVSDKAITELTTPRKRLAAEVSWLPDLTTSKASLLIDKLNKDPLSIYRVDGISALSRVNLMAAALNKYLIEDGNVLARWIIDLSQSFDEINLRVVQVLINEEREISGFPKVSDITHISDELQKRRIYFCTVLKNALNRLPTNDLLLCITNVVDNTTQYGERHGPIIIEDLVDVYELEAQAFLYDEKQNIVKIVNQLKVKVELNSSNQDLDFLVDLLIKVVKNWDLVAQPIQVSSKSRGHGHSASEELARLIRDLAIDLFNKHEKLELSQKLTRMMQEVFAEVVNVADQAEQDADALETIAHQINDRKEQEATELEGGKSDMSWSVEFGGIFKERLSITPDKIEWKGTSWDVNKISKLRWGGIPYSSNPMSSGTKFIILLSYDGQNWGRIELFQEDIFNIFEDKLWKLVCVPILKEMLTSLSNGNRIKVGNTILHDEGVMFERVKMFSKNETKFCAWNEIEMNNYSWGEPGYFCIRIKGDKKFSASFSYLKQDNIRILEAAIRMLFKMGGTRLSDVMP